MSPEQIFALLQTIGTWVAVAAALLAVYWQNHNSRQLLRVQLSVQLARQYEDPLMQSVRSRLAARLLANPGHDSINDGVLLFLENVSHLSRTKQLDDGLVWNSFGFDIPYYWAALKPQIEAMRRDFSDPSLYEELEAMAHSMSSANRSHRGTPTPELDLSPAAVKRFLQLEVNRATDQSAEHSHRRILNQSRRNP